MKFENVDVIPFPREQVYRALRDELPKMLPFLPNISDIHEREREELGELGELRILNFWRAKCDIPRVARSVVTPEMMEWLDHASWHEREWCCDWHLETFVMSERFSCGGRNSYRVVEGDKTEMTIRGELTIDARGIKGVPDLMASTVSVGLEKFIISLVKPNFRRLNEGLVRYLRDGL